MYKWNNWLRNIIDPDDNWCLVNTYGMELSIALRVDKIKRKKTPLARR